VAEVNRYFEEYMRIGGMPEVYLLSREILEMLIGLCLNRLM
jgi:predicted AAA+ superfamily ATPase